MSATLDSRAISSDVDRRHEAIGQRVLEDFRRQTDLDRRRIVTAIRRVLRKKWWAVLVIAAILLCDVVVTPFIDFWSPRALAADVFSSGLALALTAWLYDDLIRERQVMRWGPLSSYASQQIIRSAARGQRRVGRLIEGHVEQARETLAPQDAERYAGTPYRLVFAAGLQATWRMLDDLKSQSPARDLDDALARWGALATTVPENATWLSLAAELRQALGSAVAGHDELVELLTETVRRGEGDIRRGQDGEIVVDLPHGLSSDLQAPYIKLIERFDARWHYAMELGWALEQADRTLRTKVTRTSDDQADVPIASALDRS